MITRIDISTRNDGEEGEKKNKKERKAKSEPKAKAKVKDLDKKEASNWRSKETARREQKEMEKAKEKILEKRVTHKKEGRPLWTAAENAKDLILVKQLRETNDGLMVENRYDKGKVVSKRKTKRFFLCNDVCKAASFLLFGFAAGLLLKDMLFY